MVTSVCVSDKEHHAFTGRTTLCFMRSLLGMIINHLGWMSQPTKDAQDLSTLPECTLHPQVGYLFDDFRLKGIAFIDVSIYGTAACIPQEPLT
jgi:hypothetical protein